MLVTSRIGALRAGRVLAKLRFRKMYAFVWVHERSQSERVVARCEIVVGRVLAFLRHTDVPIGLGLGNGAHKISKIQGSFYVKRRES